MAGGVFMSIVNTGIPITARDNDRCILEIVKAYPFCRTEVLAQTPGGRPIRTLVLGRGRKKLLLTASFHANEWITGYILLKYAEDLCAAVTKDTQIDGQSAAALLETATLYTVPMVNPDGVDLVTGATAPGTAEYEKARALAQFYPQIPFPQGWKANLNGVDLNLQYPAGWQMAREIKFSQGFTRPGPRDYVGRAPLDQTESRALAGYLEAVAPDTVISFHSQGRLIFWEFQDIFVPGARELGQAMADASGYTLSQTPYNSSFAGYKDWFIKFWKKPGYTVEVGEGTNPLPLSQFPEIYAANSPLITAAITALSPLQPR